MSIRLAMLLSKLGFAIAFDGDRKRIKITLNR